MSSAVFSTCTCTCWLHSTITAEVICLCVYDYSQIKPLLCHTGREAATTTGRDWARTRSAAATRAAKKQPQQPPPPLLVLCGHQSAIKWQQEKTIGQGVFENENTIGQGFFLLPLVGHHCYHISISASATQHPAHTWPCPRLSAAAG